MTVWVDEDWLDPPGVCGCLVMTIQGQVRVDDSTAAGGEVFVMLLDEENWEKTCTSQVRVALEADDEAGGVADYEVRLASDTQVNLVATWDENQNGLFDPMDPWGDYVVDGAPANPLLVGSQTTSDADIQIPTDQPGLQVEPWLDMQVTVTTSDGGALRSWMERAAEGALDPGAELVIAAPPALMSEYLPRMDLARAAALVRFSAAELESPSVQVDLPVSRNTPLLPQVWVDLDGDGILAEEGEPWIVGEADYSGTEGGGAQEVVLP